MPVGFYVNFGYLVKHFLIPDLVKNNVIIMDGALEPEMRDISLFTNIFITKKSPVCKNTGLWNIS
jgi:hypothetical protein